MSAILFASSRLVVSLSTGFILGVDYNDSFGYKSIMIFLGPLSLQINTSLGEY
jgi:hypothetical protein